MGSEVTSALLTEAGMCLYNLCMYIWSCSFADGYMITTTIQAITRFDEDYMLTNVFVKLTLSGKNIKKWA